MVHRGPLGGWEVPNNKCLRSAYYVPGTVPDVAFGDTKKSKTHSLLSRSSQLTRGPDKKM